VAVAISNQNTRRYKFRTRKVPLWMKGVRGLTQQYNSCWTRKALPSTVASHKATQMKYYMMGRRGFLLTTGFCEGTQPLERARFMEGLLRAMSVHSRTTERDDCKSHYLHPHLKSNKSVQRLHLESKLTINTCGVSGAIVVATACMQPAQIGLHGRP
jgi:hypothetical protein